MFVARQASVAVAAVGDDAPPFVGDGIAGAGRVAEGGVAFPVVLAFLGRWGGIEVSGGFFYRGLVGGSGISQHTGERDE